MVWCGFRGTALWPDYGYGIIALSGNVRGLIGEYAITISFLYCSSSY